MDKGLRNKLDKIKQKSRIKSHKDSDWMDESFIGKLKNHDEHDNGLKHKQKYKRTKLKDFEDE